MKHIWWATIITIWLSVAGWTVLRLTGHLHLASVVAVDGGSLTGLCAAFLICGLFAGALDGS